MPAGFTKSMAERLNELSQVQVKEASNGEVLKNGVVYIAPGGTHIAIKKSGASHVISFNDMHLSADSSLVPISCLIH